MVRLCPSTYFATSATAAAACYVTNPRIETTCWPRYVKRRVWRDPDKDPQVSNPIWTDIYFKKLFFRNNSPIGTTLFFGRCSYCPNEEIGVKIIPPT